MCDSTAKVYVTHDQQVTKSSAKFGIKGACILFQNQGDVPVWIGLIKLLPADFYKIDIMPPHIVDQDFNIRFESASVPTSGSLRITTTGPLLIISTLIEKT